MARTKSEKAEKLSVDDVLKNLNKRFSRTLAVDFEQRVNSSDNVIPTGVISIDYELLGIGGVEYGKLYQVKGWAGTSKSTLCGTLSASNARKGKKTLYIDSEHAVDIKYFKQLGVNFNDGSFILIQPDNAEEGFSAALDLIDTGEIGLVIVDSDTMLLPKSLMDAEPGTNNIGKKANFNSGNYPKLKVAINRNNTCCICICQYRTNPGQMFGDNRTVPGGHALEFVADVIMETSKRTAKDGDDVYGLETTIKTMKNKMYIPFKSIQIETVFGKGFDYMKDLLVLGKDYGVWKLRASQITYNDVKYTESDFIALLEDNKDFQEEVKSNIINKIKTGASKDESED